MKLGLNLKFQDLKLIKQIYIAYLKKQLIIGGSSLDSVLSAEARLYDVESQEINFLAEKRKSELIIVTSLGLLSRKLGF